MLVNQALSLNAAALKASFFTLGRLTAPSYHSLSMLAFPRIVHSTTKTLLNTDIQLSRLTTMILALRS